MNVSLTINSHEIREYIAEGGIDVSTTERVSKTITTLDGTEIRRSVKKYTISVTLLDNLIASKFTTLKGYMSPNPATVTFSNYETGQTYSGTFYITNLKHQVQKSYGTDALVQGASFSLEEK